jgi:hypothetical protein
MTLVTPTKRPWITQRRCVGCGLRAESSAAGGSALSLCPRCGVDWSERPPRSYAELEGFEITELPDLDTAAELGQRSRGVVRSRRLFRALELGLFVALILVALVVASANIVGALRGQGL